MLSETLWIPNIASSQFVEYSEEKVHPIKNQLCSPNFFQVWRISRTRFVNQKFGQLRTSFTSAQMKPKSFESRRKSSPPPPPNPPPPPHPPHLTTPPSRPMFRPRALSALSSSLWLQHYVASTVTVNIWRVHRQRETFRGGFVDTWYILT